MPQPTPPAAEAPPKRAPPPAETPPPGSDAVARNLPRRALSSTPCSTRASTQGRPILRKSGYTP